MLFQQKTPMNQNNLILALYPNTHGIGYVLCEDQKNIIDYGIKINKRNDPNKFLKIVQALLDIANPCIVILRSGARDKQNKVSARIQKNIQMIQDSAQKLNLPVFEYSRWQIKDVFSVFDAQTKHEITQKLVAWYPQLRSRSFEKRKVFDSENYQMAVFDAFSLLIVHFYMEG